MSEQQLGKSRIVIVGGGAGGLELATRLGDKYGRKGKLDITLIERNRTHVWKPKLHEIAAGSMDIAAHEVDYLAQSYWHGFRYRIGEMTGIDRNRRQVQVAPYFDAEGREVTPKRAFDYDVLVVAVGSQQRSGAHYHQAIQLIRDGAIGSVHHIHAGFTRNAIPASWRAS